MEPHLSTSRKLYGSAQKTTPSNIYRVGHTATLVGKFVFVAARQFVYALDCNNFQWSRISTQSGVSWYNGQAFLVEDIIYLVSGNEQAQNDPVASQMWTFDIVQAYIQACDGKNQDLIPSCGSAGAFLEAVGMIILYGGAIEEILQVLS